MSLKPGAVWPLIEIDLGVGVIGCVLAVVWGKVSGRKMDRVTVLFLCKLFGGISLVFLVLILLNL